MKKLGTIFATGLLALLVIAAVGCSFSTANMSSLKTYKDKDAKQETGSYTAGDTIYARANIANNPGKVKIKYSLTNPGGQPVSGADVSIDLDGDGYGSYSLPSSPTMAAGAPPTAPTAPSDTKHEDDDSN